MYKRTFSLLCTIMALFVCSGCSNESVPYDTQDFVATTAPSVEDNEVNIESTANTESVETTQPTEDDLLVFGQQTINDSVQINQSEIDWAPLDKIPNDITISQLHSFSGGTCCFIPDWEAEYYDDIVITKNDDNYIGIARVEIDKLNGSELVQDGLLNLLKEKVEIYDIATNTNNTILRNDKYYTQIEGTLGEYMYILELTNVEDISFCAIAMWNPNGPYDNASCTTAIETMLESINEMQQTSIENYEDE